MGADKVKAHLSASTITDNDELSPDFRHD